MIVGGYAMDLYCENAGETLAGTIYDAYGHRYDAFPRKFHGETALECRQQAYTRGWILRIAKGEAYCPMCAKGMRR